MALDSPAFYVGLDVRVTASSGSLLPFFWHSYMWHDSKEEYMAENDIRVCGILWVLTPLFPCSYLWHDSEEEYMVESDVRVRASHGSGLPFFRCSYLWHDSEEEYMAESDVRIRASYGSGLPFFPLFLPLSCSWRNHVTHLFPVISTKSPIISGLFVEREKKGRGVKGSSPPVLLLFVIVIHIWMSHVTGMIESCDRYNWVTSHTYE